jgi:hypothetical protein
VCDILLAAECEELKVKRKEKKLMDSDFLPFIQHLDQVDPHGRSRLPILESQGVLKKAVGLL